MNEDYKALVRKVDGFAVGAQQRRAKDMACRAGCDSCCMVHLEVSPVEADALRQALSRLDADVAAAVTGRARMADASAPRCPMLGEGGRCDVYAGRPLVCRSQGLALRYPPGFISEEAVHGRPLCEPHCEPPGEVTWCPLNFKDAAPKAADVLDAERVDQMLALINRDHAAMTSQDPLLRTSLLSLAITAVDLASTGVARDQLVPPRA